MTDKEYSKQKKRVQGYIDKWFDTLGLGWFRVEMNWCRERKDESPNVAADTTTQWQYRFSSINWYLPVIAENTDEAVEGIVVHEFAHILIAPIAQTASEELDQQHEYATESIARAFQWAREAGAKQK